MAVQTMEMNKTIERDELLRTIAALPDESISAMLNFIKSLRELDSDDGFIPHIPNAETAAAIRETRSGGGEKFDSVEALMADLHDENED